MAKKQKLEIGSSNLISVKPITDNQKIDTSTNPNVRRNSRYWLRSAVMHWKGQNIYDRYSRQDLDTGEFREVLKRNIKS